MAVTMYGTAELIEVQQRLPSTQDGFWRAKYSRVITSDRSEVIFERADLNDRRLAPFVAPNVQGRVMRGQGTFARSFRPAYVKPKHVVDPSQGLVRRMGEPIMGNLSPRQRIDAVIAQNLSSEREYIERRWDWMAAQATIYGFVTVEGQDYPRAYIDFGRSAALTVTLSGTARWDQLATADPLGDLASVSDTAFATGYAPITTIIFGLTAWRNFIKNTAVLNLLDATKRGSNADFARSPLVPSSNYQSMGFIDGPGGRFSLWTYNNWYSETDEDTGVITANVPFLDPRDVVGHGEALDGVALFGAIYDVKAPSGVAEATIFPKMWEDQDPSVAYTMSQSAPLFAPMNPNNSFKLRVVS